MVPALGHIRAAARRGTKWPSEVVFWAYPTDCSRSGGHLQGSFGHALCYAFRWVPPRASMLEGWITPPLVAMEPSEPTRSPDSASSGSSTIRIGTAGWSYKDWEGIFFPAGMRQRRVHPLEYLARFFDTAEINTSFYGPLKPELAKLWTKRVAAINPDFRFTAKLYRA